LSILAGCFGCFARSLQILLDMRAATRIAVSQKSCGVIAQLPFRNPDKARNSKVDGLLQA
jgi:hypothetical protein